VKNWVIRRALRCFQKKRHKTEKPERILVVATTALGDTLWATPGLESLRASFPNSYLAVLTSPIGKEILQNNPWTNRIFLFQKPLRMVSEIYKERFDTALIFHASQRLALPLAAASGACRIVGTLGLNKGLDSLLTHPLPNDRQHEIVRRLKMVEAIGGTIEQSILSKRSDFLTFSKIYSKKTPTEY